MKDRKHMYRWIMLALFLASLCCAALPAAGEDSKRVAIFPFQIYSEKDLSFLQKGIVDMLASRLAQSGRVTVISRQETEQALADTDGPIEVGQATRIGGELGADFVLFGSLTVFGNSVSINAKMVDVSGESEPVAIFTQSEMGQVIAEINQFALDINEKVFGLTVAAKEPAAPAAPKEPTPEIYAHPDKLMQGGFGIETTTRTGRGYQDLWKSRNFNYTINGVSLGDVDGDGKTDIVVTNDHQVFVYRLEGKRFFEITRSKARNSAFHVGVDTGDIITSDGVDEIFVSSMNAQKNALNSFVLGFEKGELKRLVDNDPNYLRVIALPDRVENVLGQFQRVAGGPFASPIEQMELKGDRFNSVQKILPGNRSNLLGFAMGDATNSGEDMILYFDSKDRLNLRDNAGRKVWSSAGRYGGSPVYLRIPIESPGDIENRSYFPMRVRIVDLGEDGSYETIVVKNHEMAGRRLETFRHYNKTEVNIMVWDGISLSPVWKTRTMSGHIRDFDVGDVDNDGKEELIAAVVLRSGKTIGVKAKSFLMAFDLPDIKLIQEDQ